MQQYLDLALKVLQRGEERDDRTGEGTISIFGHQMEFDLQEGFPLVTTKKMATKAMISELLWFLEGSTDERRLAEIHYGDKVENLIGKKTIWTANADAQGKALGYTNTDTVKELGPVYGYQWRSCLNLKMDTVDKTQTINKPIDQIAEVIQSIKTNPDSRRHIVSAWNVAEIDKMALPPCHCLVQFYVTKSGKLDCQLYQRSADLFLGVPFNIASYALLTMMIAQVCGLEPGRFVHTFGDVHIYKNHIDQVKEQLQREPKPLPNMELNPGIMHINDFTMDDFILTDYDPHPAIKALMAV